MEELRQRASELEERLTSLKPALRIEESRERLRVLQEESGRPDLWSDSEKAGLLMQELAEVEREVGRYEEIGQSISETRELIEASISEDDPSLARELGQRLEGIAFELDRLEHSLRFAGPYDRYPAYLSIYAGTGGTDAQDFAEMLLRMYLRFAEKQGFRAEIRSISEGEEAGIKSVTAEVQGPQAYGLLRGEHGVHRLVRLSPFNAQNLRQTSFALVDVIPILPAEELDIKESDLRVDVFRSSGAGGQSVNTTDSAVRITHLPTGAVATCQNERSQLQNRERAMEILRAKLAVLRAEELKDQVATIRGDVPSAEWGSQIRSYVLHPYRLVKDHRTRVESSDTEGVLDGDLQPFIDGYLAWSAGEQGGSAG